MAKKQQEKKISPYTLLSRWINDGSKNSKIPKDLIDDKSIGPQYILYYFQSSPISAYISNTFNNYNIYTMERVDVYKMIKDIVLKTGFKPKFIPKQKKINHKLYKILRKKYPYLKPYETYKIIDIIDNSSDKDLIYETVGLKSSKPKKKKVTKAQQNKLLKKEKTIFVKQAIDNKNDLSTLLDKF